MSQANLNLVSLAFTQFFNFPNFVILKESCGRDPKAIFFVV